MLCGWARKRTKRKLCIAFLLGRELIDKETSMTGDTSRDFCASLTKRDQFTSMINTFSSISSCEGHEFISYPHDTPSRDSHEAPSTPKNPSRQSFALPTEEKYRHSSVITSHLSLHQRFHETQIAEMTPPSSDSLEDFSHLTLCTTHIVGFIALLVILSRFMGVHVLQGLRKATQSPMRLPQDYQDVEEVIKMTPLTEGEGELGKKPKGAKKKWDRSLLTKKRKCVSMGPIMVAHGRDRSDSPPPLPPKPPPRIKSPKMTQPTSSYVCVKFFFLLPKVSIIQTFDELKKNNCFFCPQIRTTIRNNG